MHRVTFRVVHSLLSRYGYYSHFSERNVAALGSKQLHTPNESLHSFELCSQHQYHAQEKMISEKDILLHHVRSATLPSYEEATASSTTK